MYADTRQAAPAERSCSVHRSISTQQSRLLFILCNRFGCCEDNRARLTQQSNTASYATGSMFAPTSLPVTQPCEDSAAGAGSALDDLPASRCVWALYWSLRAVSCPQTGMVVGLERPYTLSSLDVSTSSLALSCSPSPRVLREVIRILPGRGGGSAKLSSNCAAFLVSLTHIALPTLFVSSLVPVRGELDDPKGRNRRRDRGTARCCGWLSVQASR